MTQLFLAATQASFFVYLALYLQEGRGLDPLEAGLVFTILAVAYVAVSGPAPRLTERYGRAVVAVGAAALAFGLGLLAVATADVGVDGSILVFLPGLVLVGAGIGLCFTPLTSTVLGGTTRRRSAPPPARCRPCSRSATRWVSPSPASSSSAPAPTWGTRSRSAWSSSPPWRRGSSP